MKRRKTNIVVAVFTVICGIISLVSAFFKPLLTLYLANKSNIDIKNAASVGIIGGADGPTAIFISDQGKSSWFTVVFALLTILGAVYLFFEKYKKHE